MAFESANIPPERSSGGSPLLLPAMSPCSRMMPLGTFPLPVLAGIAMVRKTKLYKQIQARQKGRIDCWLQVHLWVSNLRQGLENAAFVKGRSDGAEVVTEGDLRSVMRRRVYSPGYCIMFRVSQRDPGGDQISASLTCYRGNEHQCPPHVVRRISYYRRKPVDNQILLGCS